jgi:predicted membrane protein
MKMFSNGVFALLLEVVSSWQVIVVTVAIILYIYLVGYVARSYHRPRVKRAKVKKQKPEPVAVQEDTEEKSSKSNSDEELGLEED